MADPVIEQPVAQAPASTPAPSTPTPSPTPAPTPTASPAATPASSEPASFGDTLRAKLAAQEGAAGTTEPVTATPSPAAPLPGATVAPAAVGAPGAQALVPGQPAATPAAKPEWFKTFTEQMGFNADRWEPEQLIGQLKDTINNSRQQAQELQALRQQVQQYQQFPQQQAPAPGQPAAPVKPKAWYEAVPEWDTALESKLMLDDNGQVVARPNEDPALVGRYRAWKDHEKATMQRFAKDPMGTMRELMGEDVKKMAMEMVQGTLKERDTAQQTSSILERNSPWVFNPVNPFTGQRTPTPIGQAYIGHVQKLTESSPEMAPTLMDEMAKKLAYADMVIASQSGQQPGTVQQVQPQQQQLPPGQQWAPTPMIQASITPPPTNGFTALTNAQPGVTTNGVQPSGDYGQFLRQQAIAAGVHKDW